MRRRSRAAAALLAAPVLLLTGCALPGQTQDPALCPPVEESWNAFAADPAPENREAFETALDALQYENATSTAVDAARSAKSALQNTLARRPVRNQYFWNALDLIARECAEAGVELSFDGHGEPLPAVG
ncbi:hypothetical protein [Rathayibacter sp. VKM Ac-2857]|uniref:hypothetical protein n=1 Tax=Rathayibacter sp. VKM Ac-2857 TaxID=2739020 RepID=UPI0015645095|nr:hypothetical protein [Rathayibacter sp. VKM Ac-2857]NQX16392.1 hypothetical protein [Rathayibacter sp. VKM Ac-2857]